MQTNVTAYPWNRELERTVVHSLCTSFGLDFLLFEDKAGGNVDTVHNVRQGIHATEAEKQRYQERGDYKERSSAYHSHDNYKATGKRDKDRQQAGTLHDPYRNRIMASDETRNLDHVISAKEIHDDPGRVLAEQDGIELANHSSNLQTTQETINKSKKQTPIDTYLDRLPELISTHEKNLESSQRRLADMSCDTPEQKHKARQLEDEIRKDQQKIDSLKSIDAGEMRKRDKEARREYEQAIASRYYASSKFAVNAARDAGMSGLRMGTRQMLGLVLAEFWFELRERIPAIFEKIKANFDLGEFIDGIKKIIKGSWARIQTRFNDFLSSFKDGVFAGAMSSMTTTLVNIFVTTQTTVIKLIREMWGQMVKAFKLIFFNPDQLAFVDLCKAVTSVLSVGVATSVGTIVYAQVVPVLSFPFGGELAAFVGALTTGVVTLGLS